MASAGMNLLDIMKYETGIYLLYIYYLLTKGAGTPFQIVLATLTPGVNTGLKLDLQGYKG